MPIYKDIKCPNHGEPLEGVESPLPTKGIGICPVSKCPFHFEANPESKKLRVNSRGEYEEVCEYTINGKD